MKSEGGEGRSEMVGVMKTGRERQEKIVGENIHLPLLACCVGTILHRALRMPLDRVRGSPRLPHGLSGQQSPFCVGASARQLALFTFGVPALRAKSSVC